MQKDLLGLAVLLGVSEYRLKKLLVEHAAAVQKAIAASEPADKRRIYGVPPGYQIHQTEND